MNNTEQKVQISESDTNLSFSRFYFLLLSVCVPNNIGEEAFAVASCIFDDCNSHAAEIKNMMVSDPAFQKAFEDLSFRMKSGDIGSGSMADSNKELILGVEGSPYQKSSCEVPYDPTNTETLYIMGWEPSVNNALEKDGEKARAAEKAKAGFRFKQLTKNQHGYKIKLGGLSLL